MHNWHKCTKSFLIVRTFGAHSEWLEVLSGIPQGSGLGVILFVLSMPAVVQSIIKLFADDTKRLARVV